MNKTKCAIYVRKSSERGLDQEFNSLDNQELACKSYITSQQFQGWRHIKTYADGGISGGTMARPGLQELLTDIRDGKADLEYAPIVRRVRARDRVRARTR
ncbi:MAG: recombinase family protein [Rickettsiales bacterium]|nr:recombinase family protein [Rickettsiales bacterium]